MNGTGTAVPDSLDDRPAERERLSALMDGDEAVVESTCAQWRHDRAMRAEWHAYQVIGELLRSDDPRVDAARDARFLACVRDALSREPVVLAPNPVPAPARRARLQTWMAPAAVAAGFVAVAGVLLVTRVAVPDGQSGVFTAFAPATVAPAQGAAAPPQLPEAAVLVRNAELDRYLEAHRQFANVSTLAAPGGVVRSAATAAPGR
jgi:sigma-E factor negative regulatory protein RseA